MRSSPIRPTRAAGWCTRSSLAMRLAALAIDATVFAPDATGAGFFRDTLCATVCVAASPVGRGRAGDGRNARRRLRPPFRTRGKPALRRLARAGRHFGKRVGDAQGTRPDFRLCPHRASRRHVRRRAACGVADARHRGGRSFVRGRPRCGGIGSPASSDRDACHVGNGVDRSRFSPTPDATDGELRAAPRPAPRRAGIPRGRRGRGTQEYHSSSAGLPGAAAAAPLGAAGDRRRRFAPRPRRLSGAFRRGAGA